MSLRSLDFRLYRELLRLARHIDAHPEWRAVLSVPDAWLPGVAATVQHSHGVKHASAASVPAHTRAQQLVSGFLASGSDAPNALYVPHALPVMRTSAVDFVQVWFRARSVAIDTSADADARRDTALALLRLIRERAHAYGLALPTPTQAPTTEAHAVTPKPRLPDRIRPQPASRIRPGTLLLAHPCIPGTHALSRSVVLVISHGERDGTSTGVIINPHGPLGALVSMPASMRAAASATAQAQDVGTPVTIAHTHTHTHAHTHGASPLVSEMRILVALTVGMPSAFHLSRERLNGTLQVHEPRPRKALPSLRDFRVCAHRRTWRLAPYAAVKMWQRNDAFAQLDEDIRAACSQVAAGLRWSIYAGDAFGQWDVRTHTFSRRSDGPEAAGSRKARVARLRRRAVEKLTMLSNGAVHLPDAIAAVQDFMGAKLTGVAVSPAKSSEHPTVSAVSVPPRVATTPSARRQARRKRAAPDAPKDAAPPTPAVAAAGDETSLLPSSSTFLSRIVSAVDKLGERVRGKQTAPRGTYAAPTSASKLKHVPSHESSSGAPEEPRRSWVAQAHQRAVRSYDHLRSAARSYAAATAAALSPDAFADATAPLRLDTNKVAFPFGSLHALHPSRSFKVSYAVPTAYQHLVDAARQSASFDDPPSVTLSVPPAMLGLDAPTVPGSEDDSEVVASLEVDVNDLVQAAAGASSSEASSSSPATTAPPSFSAHKMAELEASIRKSAATALDALNDAEPLHVTLALTTRAGVPPQTGAATSSTSVAAPVQDWVVLYMVEAQAGLLVFEVPLAHVLVPADQVRVSALDLDVAPMRVFVSPGAHCVPRGWLPSLIRVALRRLARTVHRPLPVPIPVPLPVTAPGRMPAHVPVAVPTWPGGPVRSRVCVHTLGEIGGDELEAPGSAHTYTHVHVYSHPQLLDVERALRLGVAKPTDVAVFEGVVEWSRGRPSFVLADAEPEGRTHTHTHTHAHTLAHEDGQLEEEIRAGVWIPVMVDAQSLWQLVRAGTEAPPAPTPALTHAHTRAHTHTRARTGVDRDADGGDAPHAQRIPRGHDMWTALMSGLGGEFASVLAAVPSNKR